MNVLLIEDDPVLCETLKEQLKKNQYKVDVCLNGGDAWYYFEQAVYDVILIDRMLPEVDGLTLLKRLRDSKDETKVIMITAMNGLYDRIDGLDAGADDYIVKPFETEELLARIRALLRRPSQMARIESLTYGTLTYDRAEHAMTGPNGKSMHLSMKESAMLEFFMDHPNQVITRVQIMNRVWGGDDFVDDGNIDRYIHMLRKRLKSSECNLGIQTVYGLGYRIEVK